MWTVVSVLLPTLRLPQITCFAAQPSVLGPQRGPAPVAEPEPHYGIMDLFRKLRLNWD